MATDADTLVRTHVPPPHRLSFTGLVRSELIKLLTARSLVTMLILTVLCTAGISIPVALTTETEAARSAAETLPNFIDTTLLGMQLSILLVAVLSAVAGASDFGNGTIRVAFAAAPRRTPVLAAKLAVVAGVTTVLISATLLLTAVVSWTALTPGPLWTPFTSSTSLLSLVGAVITTLAVSVSAVSLGCLLRSSGKAIAAVLGLLIVVSIVLLAIPSRILPPAFSDYVFGGAVTTLLGTADDLGAWVGAVVALVAWSAAFIACAAAAIRRRDA
ncbi:hypothetical protein ACIQMO_08145 [Streptomyces sp. NPDC091406]|uniref:hypothetical protein n=1 Tax=unclassified Streptomyces TaxID=2593676 RepID=UPI003828F7BB